MIQNIPSLLQLAKKYGLNLVTDKNDFDKSGLDFLVLQARDAGGLEWIVKTPRHPNAYKGSVNEAKIQKLLLTKLSVAIPNWKVQELDLIGYPRLQGTPAWTYDPQEGLRWNGLNVQNPQETFLESTARFLAELHLVDKKAVFAAGGRQLSIQEVRSKILNTMQSTREILQPSDAVWHRWMHWIQENSYWPSENALVHGDLHPGHMLLDESFSLVGVLDWTEAEIADPAVDFGTFFACFGLEQLQRLLELYKKAEGKTYERMVEHITERWAANAAFTAQWAIENKQEEIVALAKQQLAATESQMLEK